MIYRFEELTSTNDEARADRYAEGDLVVAERQTAGRGQRGHTWLSPEGENLTFTLVVEPKFLAARDQFLISETAALALSDTFRRYAIETRIKWTNDIYHEDRKLVGILIEHFYSGTQLRRTLIGIGININQTHFDPSLPNPVSMRQILGRTLDREAVLDTFAACFAARYEALKQADYAAIAADYTAQLYRLGREQRFRLPEGEEFTATIEGVKPDGVLLLRHTDGSVRGYRFKEVEFVVKSLLLEK